MKGLISENMVKSSASIPEITHDKVTLVKKEIEVKVKKLG
jgi:hypothetical protein